MALSTALLSSCGPSEPPDPNAPKFEMMWVAANENSDANPELAKLICEPRAKAAEVQAKNLEEAKGSGLETNCVADYLGNVVCDTRKVSRGGGIGFDGMARGMNISRIGHRAYTTVFAGCMAENGVIEKNVCVKNCANN